MNDRKTPLLGTLVEIAERLWQRIAAAEVAEDEHLS